MSNNKAFPKFGKTQDLKDSHFSQGDSDYHMKSHLNVPGSLLKSHLRKDSQHSIAQKPLNKNKSGLVVSLSRTLNLGSSISMDYHAKLKRKQRLASRSVIDPEYTEKDLDEEPEVKYNSTILYVLMIFMVFQNFGCSFIFDFP